VKVPLRKELRNFNLMRISDVTALEDEFVMGSNFDIWEYLNSSFGIYKGSDLHDVKLRYTPERALWARGRGWHPKQTETELPDGSLEITFPVADFIEIKMQILRHGAGVVVLEPKELRAMVLQEAKDLCRIYSDGN
jgi:proteasome accessory factor C